MEMEIVMDVGSLDPELLQLPDVSPLALKSNPLIADELFAQWLSFPETGYNPKRYADVDDDVSDMEANFDDILREERRSAKIAREEDEREQRLIEEEERRIRMRKEAKKRKL